MMIKLRNLLQKRTNERADIVQTVLVFPIAIIFLFALINLSSYFQIRAQVQNVSRDGARLVALYGGQSTSAVRNNSGSNVDATIKKSLWDGKKCTLSFCTQQPTVTCTPNVATQAGQSVSCTIKYYYSPIAPVWNGLEGLNGVFGQPISVTSTYVSETGTK